MEFNMAWFWEAIGESTNFNIFIKDKQWAKENFEAFIEKEAYKYIVVKAFKITEGEENKSIDNYGDIWDYLTDRAIEYEKEHPEDISIEDCEDSDSDSTDDEEGTESQWHCDQHEDHPLLHDGLGGYNCSLCDEKEAKVQATLKTYEPTEENGVLGGVARTEPWKRPTVCDVPCERRTMNGRSWWKNQGYNSPCGCAWNALEKYVRNSLMD
jgi:hypothetical protein